MGWHVTRAACHVKNVSCLPWCHFPLFIHTGESGTLTAAHLLFQPKIISHSVLRIRNEEDQGLHPYTGEAVMFAAAFA
jgi:hypothetical protein